MLRHTGKDSVTYIHTSSEIGKVMVVIFTMQKTDNSVLWLMITNSLEGKKFIVFVNENCEKKSESLLKQDHK